ncbi:MAG TPA: DUF1398 family protein [Polyangia bacterium]
MQTQVRETMVECTNGSDEGRLSFPEVVRALVEAGVERYHADLQRAEKTYYLPSGESLVVPARHTETKPAIDFDAAGVEAAVRQIQAQKLTYLAFCERIPAAGCVGYFVSLAGRRAVYFGRSAESFVEPFPSAK